MHILIVPSEHFITESHPLGGIFQYHQAKALAKAGYKVGILSVGYITPRYLLRKYNYKVKEKVYNINILRDYKKLFFPHRFIPFSFLKQNYIKMADDLYHKYLEENGQPDLIHAHNFLYAGLIASTFKKKYGLNYIITEHSSSLVKNKIYEKNLELFRLSAQSALKVTAVSSALQKLMNKFSGSVELLPNIVDDSFFDADLIDNNKNKFIFLNVANLVENKNHELLINSFYGSFKGRKDVLLRIAGDGYMRKSLESLTEQLDINDQVQFLGRIAQEQVRSEMMNADCFVLQSNYETFGVVLIESLACGTPVIATKCGGPNDVINSSNGILIDVGSQEQLETAMLKMYDNADKYEKKMLREDVKKRFGEEAFVENATKYYKSGLGNG